jgi:hypothetical protein
VCYRGLIDLEGSTLVSLLCNGDTSGANIRDSGPDGYIMNTMLPSNIHLALSSLCLSLFRWVHSVAVLATFLAEHGYLVLLLRQEKAKIYISLRCLYLQHAPPLPGMLTSFSLPYRAL